jgi:hypothetical protein
MLKSKAIELLGGSVASAAKAIGVSYQAVDKWPDELSPRIADRVLAALARQKAPTLMRVAEKKAAAQTHEKPSANGEQPLIVTPGYTGPDRRKSGCGGDNKARA